MDRSRDVLTPRALVGAWLAAAASLPALLLIAVAGQGVGSVLAGCRWIGLSTPVDRQVWALVNQPTAAFAAQPAAIGYWLGATVVVLLVAALTTPLAPRPRTLAAELTAIQLAWLAAVVGLAWMPVLDLGDGHLARWLSLRRLPEWLVWAPLAASALVVVSPSFRLLALLAATRKAAGRLLRLAAVALHLVLPLTVWVAGVSLLHGRVPLASAFAVSLVVALPLGLAWVGLPRPHVLPLGPVTPSSLVRLLLTAVLLSAVVVVAGRPLGDGRRAGVLWSTPSATNNVRPWIAPVRLPGVGRGEPFSPASASEMPAGSPRVLTSGAPPSAADAVTTETAVLHPSTG